MHRMDASALPTVRLRNAWRSSHPWIFQKLVEKPAVKPKPGSLVDVIGVEGEWIGRGFYNGHSRIAVRLLEADQDTVVDAAWFAHRIGEAVRLRRELLRLDQEGLDLAFHIGQRHGTKLDVASVLEIDHENCLRVDNA